jgi:hypothetical protein
MIGTYFFALGLALTSGTFAADFKLADGPPTAGAFVPSDPVFSALLTDGTLVSGQVRRLGEKDGVTLVTENGEERSIPIDRLVKLTREGTPPPAPTEGGDMVLFPDGDRLVRCKVGQAGEFNLAVHSTPFENLSIPLESLLGLVFDANLDSTATDALVTRVRSEPREAELLWLKNGDKLPGLFSGLDDRKLTFQPETGKVELPRDGVVALGFPQGQVAYRRPEGPYFELKLGDGSRLGVSGVKIERGYVVATTRFKSMIRFPIGELAQIHVINASVVYLSDREPNGSIYEPYIGPTRPYRRNATVSGDLLRLGGRTYDRGVGTYSRTLLVYKLEPGSKRFQALVGVDDRAGPLGNVVFKVRVDDKIRYESSPMVAGEAAKSVDVDLTGASFLILMTEFGERGDVQDHADWVEARIIR